MPSQTGGVYFRYFVLLVVLIPTINGLRAAHFRPDQDEEEEEDAEEPWVRQDDQEEERGGNKRSGESGARVEGSEKCFQLFCN